MVVLAVLVSALTLAAPAASAQETGEFTFFAYPGASRTQPVDINDSGVVAGWYEAVGVRESFLRFTDGTFISFMDERRSTVTSINNNGDVVGFYQLSGIGVQGYLRSADGTITQLGDLIPTDINDSGEIVGYDESGDGVVSVMRAADGTLSIIDTGLTSPRPAAISETGVVVGQSGSIAWVVTDGVVETEFDPTDDIFSLGYIDINSSGYILGQYRDEFERGRGYLAAPDGTVSTFGDSTDQPPAQMNDAGTVVGYRAESFLATTGYVRDLDGTITLVSTDGFSHTQFVAINNGGDILGFAGPQRSRPEVVFIYSGASAPVEECAAGTFSGTGEEPCEPAPAGSFVADAGASAAVLCAPGSFSAVAGAAQCELAPAGSFVADAGASAAVLCAPGSFSAVAGAAQCELAPAGSFVANAGATEAVLCAPGSFSAESGALSCTVTPAGTFVSGEGASAATPCPEGTSSEAGAVLCSEIPPVVETERDAINEAADQLDIAAANSSGVNQFRLNRAGTALDQALADDRWNADGINETSALRTLSNVRSAIRQVEIVSGRTGDEVLLSELDSIEAALLGAMANLAETAVAEATDAGGNGFLIGLADRQLDRAERFADQGRASRAASVYRFAFLVASLA